MMQMPAPYPRRYSSASRHGPPDDLDYELDFNDASRTSSPVSTRSEPRRRDREHRHRSSQSEDIRRKYARLKGELELERTRTKQLHKEKTEELRQLRELFEKDRKQELESIKSKLEKEKQRELAKMRDNLVKEKDFELQQVLKYKDDELKHLRSVLSRQHSLPQSHHHHDSTDAKVQTDEEASDTEREKMPEKSGAAEEEMRKLKEDNAELEKKYKKKCEEEARKEKEFAKLKESYDQELRNLLAESKRLAIGNLKKLKKAEQALNEGGVSDDESIASLALSLAEQSLVTGAAQGEGEALSAQLNRALLQEQGIPVNEDALSTEKREERERERTLQKKIGELQTQIQRLERRISLLRTENDTLKKKQEDQKPLEEKIKTLKKRNAELAAIARRLEEKAKSLQQENLKKGQASGGAETEHLKRLFARQRAKDLADHAKGMLAKDREIEDLRKKCQELADQLSNGEFLSPQNAQMYEEKEELVTIIKQAAKERLQIERQLAKAKPNQVVQSGDAERARQLQELEEANAELQGEIVKLNELRRQTDYLDRELKQKDDECTGLRKDLEVVKKANKDLEEELYESTTKNSQLVTELSEAQRKLQEAEKVKEECSSLRLNLIEVQQERQEAEDRVTTLQNRVDSLENLVKELQESSEELQHLEEDYKQALQRLTLKQQEIDSLQEAQEEAKAEHQRAVAELQARLTEVQEQCKAQERRQEELNAELTSLRVARRGEVTYKATVSAQVQTEVVSLASTGTDAWPLPQPPSLLHDNSQGGGAVQGPASYTNALGQMQQGTLRRRSSAEDPELKEIAQKLQELEADSDDDLRLQEEKDDSGMESNKDSRTANEVSLSDSRLSSLARKGPIQVYVAKYSYDPFKYSPNENPETELPLNAGDYVLILGDMDEDGFYEGELIDGRRGLVPSNFIERVAEEDLADFHAAMAMATCHSDDSTVNSVQHDLDFSSTEEQESRPGVLEAEDRRSKGDNLDDLEDIEEVDEDSIPIGDRLRNQGDNDKVIPYPRELKLDRQLTSSIMISWRPPEGINPVDIKSYHVFVDADFKTSIRGNERTKALVENIDPTKPHRVSVRCISTFGQSREPQCTILIGRDVLPTPSELQVSDITANSATISWLPGNSNYQHSITVDGREVRVVKPGVYRHTLTGLSPDTVHRVTVCAKNPTASFEEEKNKRKLSVSTEFRTKPGGGEGDEALSHAASDKGLPDPPLNVLLEAGPREGSLLVTWLPVTITTSGFSNGAVVEGYVVYSEGRRIKTARGPTNDHCVVDAEDFMHTVPRQLTVRTITREGKESVDSEIVQIPQSLLKEMSFTPVKTHPTAKSSRKSPKSPLPVGENAGNDTDEEIEAAFRDVVAEEASSDTSPLVEPQFAEPYIESSSSELSDIPEVEEELLAADEANDRTGPLGSTQSPIEPANQPRKFVSQTEQGKKSPKPTPRRLMPAPQQEGGQSEKLLTPRERVAVPSIEITRDSSTERGNSFEEEVEGGTRSKTGPPGGQVPHEHRSLPSPGKYGANKDGRDGFREPVRSAASPARPTPSPRPHHRAPKRNPSDPQGRRRTPDYEENGDNDSISGEINPPVHDNKVRLFIALFDYEPTEMSPNVDSLEEELPFREGQILKVFGEKDADGFYRGECNGRMGFIPCNMVSEVQIDDPELVEQLLQETQGNPITKSQLSLQEKESSPRQVHLTPNGIMPHSSDSKRMVALYDYDPQELSPNVDSDLELAFKAGDIIYIQGEMDEDGFYMGEISGRRGLVPSNFLQEAPLPGPASSVSGLSDDEALESASMVSPSRSGESFSTTSRQSEGLNNTGRQDQLSPRLETITMESVIQLQPTSPARHKANPSPEEDKPKKKGGILNKGKNIFKKLAR